MNEPPEPSLNNHRRQAEELCAQAFHAQMQGDLERALELYQLSIALCPTPAAYTFRGWAYSFQGEYEQAIDECLLAIDLDPAFPNPYNDIGAYLIETGRLEEAIPWLEQAAQNRTYTSPFFAFFNLGRVYERQGLLHRARRHYLQALDSNPDYLPARRGLTRISAQPN